MPIINQGFHPYGTKTRTVQMQAPKSVNIKNVLLFFCFFLFFKQPVNIQDVVETLPASVEEKFWDFSFNISVTKFQRFTPWSTPHLKKVLSWSRILRAYKADLNFYYYYYLNYCNWISFNATLIYELKFIIL